MYVRRKSNTAASSIGIASSASINTNNNHNNNNSNTYLEPASPMSRASKKVSAPTHRVLPMGVERSQSFSSSVGEEKSPVRSRSKNEKVVANPGELHHELKHLADEKDVVAAAVGGVGNGVKRLLKGKKLVRVKRVAARGEGGAGEDPAAGAPLPGGDRPKVLRVKVKRKKKEETVTSNTTTSSNDVDSMAPVKRGIRGRRRHRSDGASVGTGVLSKAKSWFTFGGMKLGSGGKDFLNTGDDEDEEEEEDDDRLTQAQDDYDEEATMDVRTTTPDEATATVKDESVVVQETPTTPVTPTRPKAQRRPLSASLTSVSSKQQQQHQQQQHHHQQHQLEPVSPRVTATAPTTTTTTSSSMASPNKAQQPSSPERPVRRRSSKLQNQNQPAQEIVISNAVPKRQPLTGVALKRLKIQEQWLSVGCNYKPNEALTAAMADDSEQEDVSEISFEDPITLVMGPNATPDGEVEFWYGVCENHRQMYGYEHKRTAEACLNKGVAELNARDTMAAIESFLEGVQLLQTRYGESHLAVARAMHLLGSAFFLNGQLPMAVEATRKAFDIRKEILGAFHTDTVDTFSNLAMIYLKMSKLFEASRIFNEVLRIRKVIYDDFHPSVAFPARSLGCVYAMRKDMDRARANYVHALKAFEKHGMLAEHMDTEAEMRRFGIHPPVDEDDDGRLEI